MPRSTEHLRHQWSANLRRAALVHAGPDRLSVIVILCRYLHPVSDNCHSADQDTVHLLDHSENLVTYVTQTQPFGASRCGWQLGMFGGV